LSRRPVQYSAAEIADASGNVVITGNNSGINITGGVGLSTVSGNYKAQLSGGFLKLFYGSTELSRLATQEMQASGGGTRRVSTWQSRSGSQGIVIGTNKQWNVIILQDNPIYGTSSQRLVLNSTTLVTNQMTVDSTLYLDANQRTSLVYKEYTGGLYVVKIEPYLQVGSSSMVSGYMMTVSGSIYAYGHVTENSDERRKDIDSDDWKEKADIFIQKLDAIKYQWKDGDDKQNHIGLGAQRTEKTLEEIGLDVALVQHKDDVYGVNYSELAPMMIPSLQKDRQKINELEKKISELEMRIAALEKKE
jgi:hypothetical protein